MIRAYLDNNATTKPAPSVVAAMCEHLEHHYLNSSSAAGRVLLGHADPIAQAKRAIGRLLGSADIAEGIVITSGASEANSWAVFGATHGRTSGHLVASQVEHPSLRRAVDAARERGLDATSVAVDGNGRIDEESFRSALRPDTCLVSVMLANNETGVVQPVARLSRIVREVCPDAIIHCDATCGVGREPIDLDGSLEQVDLLSLSGHKFHGPKGIGALYIRPGIVMPAMIHGEQDEGLRGGTFNTPAAAGIAEAARLALERRASIANVALLRDELEAGILSLAPASRINGLGADRLANTSSVTIRGLDASAAVDSLAMSGICVATGSACSSGASSPSPVLLAMGLSYSDALSTLRFSLSSDTTREEIDLTIEAMHALLSSHEVRAAV